MKIFLIGLMGSGKSFLGKKISEAMNLPFIDLDSEIEKREGVSIPEIFSAEGDYFRTLEATMLRMCSEKKEFIMATGGGTPCFHENMDFIKKTGTSVFLNVPIRIIAKRLNESQVNKRPLLQNNTGNVEERLEEMFSQRIKFYQQADIIVSEESVPEIIQLVESKK